MSLIGYFIVFLVSLILIETLIIIIMSFIIKRMKNKELIAWNKKRMNIKKAKKAILEKKEMYKDEIIQAKKDQDVMAIINRVSNDILQDFNHRDNITKHQNNK